MARPTIAQAWVGLVPTLDGSQKAIQKELGDVDVDEPGKKVGGRFASAIGVGLLAATAVIAKGLTKAVEDASALNESLNAVTVSYGENADAILAQSKDSANAVGLSSEAYNSLAVQFSAFSKSIAGDGGDVAGTFDTIAGRAADFASVMNLEVADAAALFQSGLAGETEPLRRYGIDLSAAAVQAYALSEGIWDGTGAMSESQKVQARFESLMAQTSATQGDFVNTSDGLANSQRILAANGENLSAKIGSALLPALASLSGILVTVFSTLSENEPLLITVISLIGVALVGATVAWTSSMVAANVALAKNIKTITLSAIAKGKDLAASVALRTMYAVDMVKALAASAASTVRATAALVAQRAATIAMSVASKAAAAAQRLLNAAMTANPIGLIIAAIVALVAGLVWFFTKTELGRKIWEAMTKALAAAWDWLWNTILKPYIDAFIALWTWLWEHAIKPVVDFIVAYVKMMGDVYTWLWNNAIKPAIDAIAAAVMWLKDKWLENFNRIKDIIVGAAAFIRDKFQAVIDFFREAPGKIGGFFKGIGDAIQNAFKAAFNKVAGFWNDTIGKLSFTFPDWVPGVGGKKFAMPKIPMLANGGIVTRPTLAMIGEGGQSEAVIPLDRAGEFGFGGGREMEIGPYSLGRILDALDERMKLYADGREIAASATGGQRLTNALGGALA